MADVVSSSSKLHVREVSRRLVKASSSGDSSSSSVIAVSNLDLLDTDYPVSFVCIYPRPPGSFDDIVACFEAKLPSFLNHFVPLAGRVVTNPTTGFPEIHCNNEGAELVVGDAGGVALSGVDFSRTGASLCRIPMPFDKAIALSVQLVSFACGGFSVTWSWSHVVGDGCATCMVIDTWSAFARNGGAPDGVVPLLVDVHRSAVFRPPSFAASFGDAYMVDTPEQHVNVLTNQTFAERLYFMAAGDVDRLRAAASSQEAGHRRATRMEAVSVYLWKALAAVVDGAGDDRCRMGWWVNGRPHANVTPPELRAAMNGYLGNVTSFTVREATTAEILSSPAPDVAATVREAIAAIANAEHFQELVDWLEEHKSQRYIEAATVGLGSPALAVTWLATFRPDTDFGFGRAALAMPVVVGGRECSGFIGVADRPGGGGDLLVGTFVWPCLAAALESDGILKPVTPERREIPVAAAPNGLPDDLLLRLQQLTPTYARCYGYLLSAHAFRINPRVQFGHP
ncbi:hypothetical protein EJB05_14812, partial [Eragrostis curvula]